MYYTLELSFVVLNASNMEVLHKQQIYVKPERTPLTTFCAEVTGIRSSQLEEAGTLKDAITQLDDYVQKEIEQANKTFCFVTHGGWVLRIQLPREARDKNLTLPNYLSYCRMFDLKQEIQRWQVHHPEISLRSTSLRDLCEIFHLNRVTDQTVGLNAALTTVEILKHLTAARHQDVFVHPIDTNADLQQFKKEESQVIHLTGLPYEVTQGELEAWFSSNGLRPKEMKMIQTTDNSKPSISGFVVFQLHSDAMKALSLNGRCLGDKAIEVCPSSSRVIDAAGNLLAPFPVQAKSRALRPGDWICTNCEFHNFASRRHCYKCNTENPAPVAARPMPYHGGPPTATAGGAPAGLHIGDWICPNPSCGFHNYASRMQCKKCAGYKPGGNKIVNNGPPPHQQYYQQPHHYNLTLNNTATGANGPPPSAGYSSGYQQGGRPPISFRPGDWYCPNPACGFQNFASRHACFKCHTPNPNQGAQQQQYTPHYGYAAQAQQQQQAPGAAAASAAGAGTGTTTTDYTNNAVGSVGGYNTGGASVVAGGNNGGSGGYGYGQAGSGYGQTNGSYGAPGGGYSGGGGYSYGAGAGGGAGGGYSSSSPYSGAPYQQQQQSQGPPGGPQQFQFRPGDWYW